MSWPEWMETCSSGTLNDCSMTEGIESLARAGRGRVRDAAVPVPCPLISARADWESVGCGAGAVASVFNGRLQPNLKCLRTWLHS